MLQYYLRAEGLALSWVGTGRLIFSLDYTDADFEAVAERFVAAAQAMREDGWWWARRRRSTNKADPARASCGEMRRAAPATVDITHAESAVSRRLRARVRHRGSISSPRSRWSGAL